MIGINVQPSAANNFTHVCESGIGDWVAIQALLLNSLISFLISGIVLLTLLVNATTVKALVNALGLTELPAVKKLRNKGIDIQGPYAADTIFLKNNLKKFDVIIGMYHDQVLTPIKTLYGFNAINITLGLPFLRVTPDHGTNNEMIGRNKSNPRSLYLALDFLNKINEA